MRRLTLKITMIIHLFLANEELLKSFGKSKDGNTRLIKVSIEKGMYHLATIFKITHTHNMFLWYFYKLGKLIGNSPNLCTGFASSTTFKYCNTVTQKNEKKKKRKNNSKQFIKRVYSFYT